MYVITLLWLIGKFLFWHHAILLFSMLFLYAVCYLSYLSRYRLPTWLSSGVTGSFLRSRINNNGATSVLRKSNNAASRVITC